jgi:hypothetical protein
MKPEFQDRARKNEKTVLNAVSKVSGKTVAERMESSETTVSRFKNGDLAEWAAFLACAGLKVVPVSMKCYPGQIVDAMFTLAQHNVMRIKDVNELAEDDPE